MIDLGKWVTGGYRIPDEDGEPVAEGDGGIRKDLPDDLPSE